MPFLVIPRIRAVYLSVFVYFRPMPVKNFRLPHLQGDYLFVFNFSTEISIFQFNFIATLFSISYLDCHCLSPLASPIIAFGCASNHFIPFESFLQLLSYKLSNLYAGFLFILFLYLSYPGIYQYPYKV